MTKSIPLDGIYDNLKTYSRERWHGGRLVSKIDARLIVEQIARGVPTEAWKHYPSKGETKQCLR